MSRVSAVVVAYGEEPLLPECVRALLASRDVDVEVLLVDNGCTDGGVDLVRGFDGVTVIEPGRNLGLDEACNLAVATASGDLVALVNDDAVVDPSALARLSATASDPSVGIATASLRLYDDPEHMNSAGNEVHFLGFSWCGGLDEPATRFRTPRDVMSASGAAMVLRRGLWDELGGLPTEFFMYYEDTDLSLRCWRAGYRVVFVPDAVVLHRYETHTKPHKMYRLERNRLVSLFTLLDGRTLGLLVPPLLAVELAMLMLAWRRGWARDKVRGWWWLVRHRRWLRERRAALARERSVGDRELAPRYATRLLDANIDVPAGLAPLDALLAAYWKLIRPLLRG